MFLERGLRVPVPRDTDDVLAELFGERLGHSDILPARPLDQTDQLSPIRAAVPVNDGLPPRLSGASTASDLAWRLRREGWLLATRSPEGSSSLQQNTPATTDAGTTKDLALRMVNGPFRSRYTLAAGQDDRNVGTTRWSAPPWMDRSDAPRREGTVEVAEQRSPNRADSAPCRQNPPAAAPRARSGPANPAAGQEPGCPHGVSGCLTHFYAFRRNFWTPVWCPGAQCVTRRARTKPQVRVDF